MSETTEAPATPAEPRRRQARARKCKNLEHVDVLVLSRRGQLNRVRCTACGDVFPCRDVDCGHRDCEWVRSGECKLADFSRAPGVTQIAAVMDASVPHPDYDRRDISTCSVCGEPAHASETDDLDRCAKCRPTAPAAYEVRPGAACVCGHAGEEHGHDDEHPGSTACTECNCIAYEASGPEEEDA